MLPLEVSHNFLPPSVHCCSVVEGVDVVDDVAEGVDVDVVEGVVRGVETPGWRVSDSLQGGVPGLEEGGGQTGPDLALSPHQHLPPPPQAELPPGGRRSGPQEVDQDLSEIVCRAGHHLPRSPALHCQ